MCGKVTLRREQRIEPLSSHDGDLDYGRHDLHNPLRRYGVSEPPPDLGLLQFRSDYYAERHPRPSDVLLLIEVSDSSVAYDRSVRAALYAAAGVPELWIVDLNLRQVECRRNPGPDGYGEVQRIAADQRLAPLAFPEVALSVSEILGL